MEKYITDERTGLTYELIGDYYFVTGDEPEECYLGVWGQRRLEYIKNCKRVLFCQLQLSFKLYDHLFEIDEQAQDMYDTLVRQLAESEGVAEQLKATDQLEWVRRMNNIGDRAREIVNSELIYT